MHNDVYLKLKCQHACTKPKTPNSSARTILNKINNISGYGANKRQLKGHLYDTNILNYFINHHQRLCLLDKNDNSSIITHSVTHRP